MQVRWTGKLTETSKDIRDTLAKFNDVINIVKNNIIQRNRK